MCFGGLFDCKQSAAVLSSFQQWEAGPVNMSVGFGFCIFSQVF